MCGIAGFLDPRAGVAAPELSSVVGRMAETLRRRGPDDGGVWVDPEAGVALGHRRLSIIDLSPLGHQPMISRDGRLVLTYNGEIYNFADLRKDLEGAGRALRGDSDTEVLLEAIAHWGLEGALARASGMFAFALWDRGARTLSLARDRLGEKPLYYGSSGGVFLFGSELKALRAHPAFGAGIDGDVLASYLRHGYVPAPHCIYGGLRKLPPATVVSISAQGRVGEPRPYWSLATAMEAGVADPLQGSPEEAVELLDAELRRVVARRMVADVPLGALLSGGIDSSTVVGLMQAQSTRPVRTFSIGFRESHYNEAEHAKAVAAHLGTEHTELYVAPEQALEVIPGLPDLYDEPFADASQVPTALICALTRRHVTVALSGDGGDELFAGYNRYLWARSIWRAAGWAPASLRRLAAALLRGVSPGAWDRGFEALAPLLPARLRQRSPGDKLHKLAEALGSANRSELYRSLVSQWKQPAELVRRGREHDALGALESAMPASGSYTERMMYLDTLSYLPDDLLVKVDRASMGVGLEVRVPFLDHALVELAWRMPPSLKLRAGQGKWLLRQVLYRYVPPALVERPKMGFAVPIDAWLRGPLREWAEGLLDERRLHEQGLLVPGPIRRRWAEHLSGRRNWQYSLWAVLMFQAWHAHWMS